MIILKESKINSRERERKTERYIYIFLLVNDDNLYEKEIGRQDSGWHIPGFVVIQLKKTPTTKNFEALIPWEGQEHSQSMWQCEGEDKVAHFFSSSW